MSERKISELDNSTESPWWNELTAFFRNNFKNQIVDWCSNDRRIEQIDHCPAGRQWCLRAFEDIRACWDEWTGIEKCKNAICYTTDDNEGMYSPLGLACQAWMNTKLPSCAPGPESDPDRCFKMKIVTCDIWPAVLIQAVADNSCHTPEMVSTYCDNFADALRYEGQRLTEEECAITDDTFDGGPIATPGDTSESSGSTTTGETSEGSGSFPASGSVPVSGSATTTATSTQAAPTATTTQAAKCSSYTCPDAKVLKPNAADLFCAGPTCGYHDCDTCCAPKAVAVVDAVNCPCSGQRAHERWVAVKSSQAQCN
jgi:hypothetical protein